MQGSKHLHNLTSNRKNYGYLNLPVGAVELLGDPEICHVLAHVHT